MFEILIGSHIDPVDNKGLIYGGKTKQSLPRFKFPDSFSLSVNPTHYSNEEESINFIENIIEPYVEEQC